VTAVTRKVWQSTEGRIAVTPSPSQVHVANTESAGAYLNADGTRTDDLEAAATTWRENAEFLADWGLDEMNAEYAYARGLTGAGVRLGILDSGVDDRHPEFAGADKLHLLTTLGGIQLPEDPFAREVGAFDGRPLIGYSGYSDHGTHVAGTMVANRNGVGMHGVAFGASLYSATHYLAKDGFTGVRGTQFDAVPSAIAAFTENGVRFVNHSWGYSSNALPHTASEEQVRRTYRGLEGWIEEAGIDASIEAGMVHVFAAGNTTFTGIRPHAGAYASAPVLFPEIESNWLSVVNLTSQGAPDASSNYCGTTRYWCISAPGTDINSTVIDRHLSDTYEAVRIEAMNAQDPPTQREILAEIIAVEAYVRSLRNGVSGLHERLIDMQEADAETVAALVDDVLRRISHVAGSLHHFDMSPYASDTQDLLRLYRDDPFFLIDQVSDALALQGNLFPIYRDSDGLVTAFQSAFLEAIAGMGSTTGGYGLKTGTSMAAPHVTGALALVAERFGYMTAPQVRDTLLTTATDLGQAGTDSVYGWGRVNLEAALQGPGAFLGDFDVTLPEGTEDVWSNDITNALVMTGRETDRGALIKRGQGILMLSGDNTFDGFVVHDGLLSLTGMNAYGEGHDGVIEGGALSLSGSLEGNALRVNSGIATITTEGSLNGTNLFIGGTDGLEARAYMDGVQRGGQTLVGRGGRLGGIGTVGNTTIATGGTVAPGRSIGTLTVDGNYVQEAGSFFEVEMTPPDQVDQLAVTGTATLAGGTVVAQRGPGVYTLGQDYRFLTATGGLSGQFEALDTTQITPFLKLSLLYTASDVTLDVARGASFASFGTTHNQRVTGGGVDSLSDSDALLGTLVQLFPEQAMPAVDLLSGDVHATAQSVLIDSGRHVRAAALARAGAANDVLSSQGDPDKRSGAWIELQRSGGRIGSDGNAAGSEYNGNNTLLGIDRVFDNGLVLGIMGGIGEADLVAPARQHARTDLDTTYGGVYLGYGHGGFGLRAGWLLGSHELDVRRPVAYPGLEETLHARYDATTRQGFVEAGYRFGGERGGIEPYVQFAQVRVSSDRFVEAGGLAALEGHTRDVRADLSTGGLRFDVNLRGSQQAQTWLSLRGGIGYRRTGGELVPWVDAALSDGDTFTVHGAPVADDAKLIDLGVTARPTPNSLLELGYRGQFADEARDHGVNLRWSTRF